MLQDGLNNKTVRYTASTPPQLEGHLLDGAGTGAAVLKGSTTQLDEAEIRLTGTDAVEVRGFWTLREASG